MLVYGGTSSRVYERSRLNSCCVLKNRFTTVPKLITQLKDMLFLKEEFANHCDQIRYHE